MKYSNNKRYFLNGGPNGFGYVIMDKGESMNFPYKRLFHTSDYKQAEEVFETIEVNNINFPEPNTDWTPKLMIIKEKHYTSHFLIKSTEHLDETAFEFLKNNWGIAEQYNPFKKMEYSEYYKEISQDCIKLCDNERVKEDMIKNNEDYISNFKMTNEHNKRIDIIKDIMENNIIKNAYSVLCSCTFLYYDEVELTTFDNYRTH